MVVADAVVVFDELYVGALLAETMALETLNVLVGVTVGAKPVDAGAAMVALVKIGRGNTEEKVFLEAGAEWTIEGSRVSSIVAVFENVMT